MKFTSFTATAVLLAAAQHVAAVCRFGEIAVGTSYHSMTQGANDVEYYAGFIMDGNCNIIAQNGETQNYYQMCRGGYYDNAEVTCGSNNLPVSAVNTAGDYYVCYGTGDTSCDEHSPVAAYDVMACCYRA